jgi:hypothetical protein
MSNSFVSLDRMVNSKPNEDLFPTDSSIMNGFGDVMPLPAFEHIKKCVVQNTQVDSDSDTNGWSSEIENDQRYGSQLWSLQNQGLLDEYEDMSPDEKEYKMSVLDNPSSLLDSENKKNFST